MTDTPVLDFCSDAPPSRLQVGAQGQVVAGQGSNNVRATPGTAGDLLGSIPEGGQFTVLDGPGCAEAMSWWYVDYNGLQGWTAEGDSSSYWLEPLGG